MEEQFSGSCTLEIAAFDEFARLLGGTGTLADFDHVLFDTAPTGHTILLLDSALAYHREVTRQASGMPESVENLLPRLRDPDYTRVLIVTLPEATPVHEAAKLQEDLKRAGIVPFARVVNQSLSPLSVIDSVLVSRKAHESRYLHEVADQLATRTAVIPWQIEPPIGPEHLRGLVSQFSQAKVLQAAM